MWYFKSVEDKKMFNNHYGDNVLSGSHSATYSNINSKLIKHFNIKKIKLRKYSRQHVKLYFLLLLEWENLVKNLNTQMSYRFYYTKCLETKKIIRTKFTQTIKGETRKKFRTQVFLKTCSLEINKL